MREFGSILICDLRLGRRMQALTEDFSQMVYDGLKQCPPHPRVDRQTQTDPVAALLHDKVISDSTLRAGLSSRGLVGVHLEGLKEDINVHITALVRLDPKHSMELCLTMDRIPRAVVDFMWGRLTPTQEAAGIVEYKWVSIEKAMNFLDMEPLHNLGMKNGKLHKVRGGV